MQMKIKDVMDDALSQLLNHGLKESTVEDYRKSLFCPILKFFSQNNTVNYSKELLNEFLTIYELRAEKNEIGQSYLARFRRAIRILVSVAETGEADFSMQGNNVKYIPSTEHCSLINEILDKNHYQGTARKDLLPPMKHFFCYMETQDVPIGQLSDDIVLAFFIEAASTNRASMGRVARSIKLITTYLKSNDNNNLQFDYSMLSVKHGRERCIEPYSLDEIQSLFRVMDISTQIGSRDYAAVLLSLETGLRGCDIANLMLSDIDWVKQTVSIIQKKTGKYLMQPLGNGTMNAIADYILKFRPESEEPYVFLTADYPTRPINRYVLYKRLKIYKKKAGIIMRERQGYHSLRRTFATELSAAGVSLSTIMEMLGQTGINESKPYLSYSKEQMSVVAMDCSEVPLSGRYYSDVDLPSNTSQSKKRDLL